MLSRSSRGDTPLVIHLSSISAYSTFGELLRTIRNHHNTTFHADLSPKKITEIVNALLAARNGKRLSERAYADLETGRRYPRFFELEPIFHALVEKFYVEFTDLEITAYVHLARQKMAENQKPKEKVSETDWKALEATLFRILQSKPGRVHLVTDAHVLPESSGLIEDPHSRRLQAIKKAQDTDIRHLLEREEWVTQMLTYPTKELPVKLVVVQGAIGAGKSSAMALLAQRFVDESPSNYLIPFLFQIGEGKTPEDYLDEFLATIMADLTMRAHDDIKHLSLEQRVHQLFAEIKKRSELGQKVIFLLDDVQYIFPTAGEWSSAWLEFMEMVVREPHAATFYLFTRTWPGWDEYRPALAYIEHSELLNLSPEASITLWQKRGFGDVPLATLQDVCVRCGHNPQMMEMLIAQCKKFSFTSSSWGQGSTLSPLSEKKSANTKRLEGLLAQDTIFDLKMDVKSRFVLQQALTSRLNHQARQMVECLSCSPLGLPFSLLGEEFANAEVALNELVNASALDLNLAASQRAAIIPFVRESVIQSLMDDDRRDGIESRVTDLYAYWLNDLQDFRDDNEKAALIAEMIIRFMRQRHLLKASELLISFGWLCTTYGHVTRIQRVFEETTRADRGKEKAYQIGEQLLAFHISTRLGRAIPKQEAEVMYQKIHESVVKNEITLAPHMQIDVLHHMMVSYIKQKQFYQCEQMFDSTLTRITQSGLATPDVHASYLHNKSRLFAIWSEAEKRAGQSDKAHHLLINCIDTLQECIAEWRYCLRQALPLQRNYTMFKLARALNDFAYRKRLLGDDLIQAQDAIEECISLKRSCSAPASSLAVSLSEHAQILTMQGKLRLALEMSNEAVKILEIAIGDGNSELEADLGMLLVEQADIYLLQARLQEVKQCLDRAVVLIAEAPLRQNFRIRAQEKIKELTAITITGGLYQLDFRWFMRYREAASYDDLAWLAHAGPFTKDEQQKWKQLVAQRDNQATIDHMNEIVVASRQREFVRSQQERRPPHLWYPLIPEEEITTRLQQFTSLKQDIELLETNAIVRRLYCDAIEEHLLVLHQCAATAHQDQETVWQSHLALYGKLTVQEMTIALQDFCAMVIQKQHHEHAAPIARELIRQLQSWELSPQVIAEYSPIVPDTASTQPLPQQKQNFDPEVVRSFYEHVLHDEYSAPEWQVVIASARDDAYVDCDLRTVFLPPRKMSLDKVRELLAEEIERHAYRSLSGSRSPLALLSSGLAGYRPTEEGLAEHYKQRISQHITGKTKKKSWLGTLCLGLASGVMTPALSFIELAAFLEKAFLMNYVSRDSNERREVLEADARASAWRQAARTFRGIPDLSQSGQCSLRDRIYLQGYLEVIHHLDRHDELSLLVGKIGVQHVESLAELNIIAPYHSQHGIAFLPDLAQRIKDSSNI